MEDLPELFKDEDELRSLWSKPDTRKKLLNRARRKRLRAGTIERNQQNDRR